MNYSIDKNVFDNNDFFFHGEEKKFYHKPGKRFVLFPFVGNNNAEIVTDFSNIVGRYICSIVNMQPKSISISDVLNGIAAKTKIDSADKDIFFESIKQIFFDSDDEPLPTNIELMMLKRCKSSGEKKIADFLFDVLGNSMTLEHYTKDAIEKCKKNSNVLEREVITQIEMNDSGVLSRLKYRKITESLEECFNDDFKYIMSNAELIKNHLQDLLEFYFFTYTAQSCMLLNRFFEGNRDSTIPLYFSVDWEKTNQSRRCFTEGWQRLQRDIKTIFAHAIVLEMINQTTEDSDKMDYIDIRYYIGNDKALSQALAETLSEITDSYRACITDCPIMTDLKRDQQAVPDFEQEVSYLFKSVTTQFENTDRSRVYTAYSNQFETFCEKYLKNRGRSGKMLNLSEDLLIFVTKLCIKDTEQMRLNDVFKEFEKRGIYLDSISKNEVASFFEKLNLIEKKSDSGDAKYVKRIL